MARNMYDILRPAPGSYMPLYAVVADGDGEAATVTVFAVDAS